jgi:hypothetical protein
VGVSHFGFLFQWYLRGKRSGGGNGEEVCANVLDSAVTHYAYFGAFRSDVSNVGKNAAMLTEKGELTDIGSWYMGGVATHKVPQSLASRSVLGRGVYLWMVCLVATISWSCALWV